MEFIVEKSLDDAGRFPCLLLVHFLCREEHNAAVRPEDHRCRQDAEIALHLPDMGEHHRALAAEETPEPEPSPDEHDSVTEDAELHRMQRGEPPHAPRNAEARRSHCLERGENVRFIEAELQEMCCDVLLLLRLVNRVTAPDMLLRSVSDNVRYERHGNCS